MKTIYLCQGQEKRSHQSKLKEVFCFFCPCKMVQIHYMPWHAFDATRGDGHTQALTTQGPGAAGLLTRVANRQTAWATVCGNRDTRHLLPGHSQASSGAVRNLQVSQGQSQGLAGGAEGPVGQLGAQG